MCNICTMIHILYIHMCVELMKFQHRFPSERLSCEPRFLCDFLSSWWVEYDAVKKILEKRSWISRSRSILFYKSPSIRRCRISLWWLLYLPFLHRSCTNEFSGKNISRYFYVTLLRIEAPFAFIEILLL